MHDSALHDPLERVRRLRIARILGNDRRKLVVEILNQPVSQLIDIDIARTQHASRITVIHESEQKVLDGRPQFVPVEGSETELEVELVFLAMGFTGPERTGLLDDLGVEFDERGNVARDGNWASSVPGVFVAGDAGRGQSLIVWAIAEGRSCAAAVDHFLMGETDLPAPIKPTDRPLT